MTNTLLTETVMPSGRSKKHILHAADLYEVGPHTFTDTIFFFFYLIGHTWGQYTHTWHDKIWAQREKNE